MRLNLVHVHRPAALSSCGRLASRTTPNRTGTGSRATATPSNAPVATPCPRYRSGSPRCCGHGRPYRSLIGIVHGADNRLKVRAVLGGVCRGRNAVRLHDVGGGDDVPSNVVYVGGQLLPRRRELLPLPPLLPTRVVLDTHPLGHVSLGEIRALKIGLGEGRGAPTTRDVAFVVNVEPRRVQPQGVHAVAVLVALRAILFEVGTISCEAPPLLVEGVVRRKGVEAGPRPEDARPLRVGPRPLVPIVVGAEVKPTEQALARHVAAPTPARRRRYRTTARPPSHVRRARRTAHLQDHPTARPPRRVDARAPANRS